MSSPIPSGPPYARPLPVSARPGVPRPIFREPMPARPGPAFLGAASATIWMGVFALLAHSARGYFWWTVTAGVIGFAAALVLARLGDRGVAVGVAIMTGIGVAIAFVVVASYWIGGTWLPW
jgi:hypothetical protein